MQTTGENKPTMCCWHGRCCCFVLCRFIELADAIEAAFPNLIVEGNPEGTGRAGAFEVTNAASGQLLFSKLGNGGWPDPDAVVEALAASAACDLTPAGSQQQPAA